MTAKAGSAQNQTRSRAHPKIMRTESFHDTRDCLKRLHRDLEVAVKDKMSARMSIRLMHYSLFDADWEDDDSKNLDDALARALPSCLI